MPHCHIDAMRPRPMLSCADGFLVCERQAASAARRLKAGVEDSGAGSAAKYLFLFESQMRVIRDEDGIVSEGSKYWMDVQLSLRDGSIARRPSQISRVRTGSRAGFVPGRHPTAGMAMLAVAHAGLVVCRMRDHKSEI